MILSIEYDNVEEMLEKWMSLVDHIHNKHSGHGQVYNECSHGKERKWLKH